MAKSRFPQLNDRDWLHEQYVDKFMSAPEIAELVGCYKDTVHSALKRFGIEARSGGSEGVIARDFPELRDEEWLRNAYVGERKTSRQIASELGCSSALVLRALESLEIDRRKVSVWYDKLGDREWLQAQYVDELRSAQDMADEIGCSKHAVYRALARLGVERRKRTSKVKLLNDKEWLENAYVNEKLSLKQIAEIAETTFGNVGSALDAMGIQRRSHKAALAERFAGGRSGEKAANWQGGRRQLKTGYIYIYQPDHPYATKTGYVMEHRLVMEEHIGRPLEPYEIAHHRDGDKSNNDIENLELTAIGRHISEHFSNSHKAFRLEKRVIELEAEISRLKRKIQDDSSQRSVT